VGCVGSGALIGTQKGKVARRGGEEGVGKGWGFLPSSWGKGR